MVDLREYFFNCKFLKKLNEVSDGCCKDNGNKYIDFDLFAGDNFASCDSLIIKDEYLLFIEFKTLNKFSNHKDFEKWFNKHEKQILLKGYESYFLLLKLCKTLRLKEKFESIEKKFILVYKADSFKNKIHNHFKNKVNRLKIAYDDAFSIECERFIKLLQRIENVL